MKFLNDIQALQVSEDLSTEMALMLVNNVVKKRNLGNTYLKSVTLNLPAIFNPITDEATPSANTLTYSLVNQTSKTFFAAPLLSNGTPSFRPLTFADISDFYTAVDKAQLNYWTKVGFTLQAIGHLVYAPYFESNGAMVAYATTGTENYTVLGVGGTAFQQKVYDITNPRLETIHIFSVLKTLFTNGNYRIGSGGDSGFAKFQVNGSIQQSVTTSMLKANANGVLVGAVDGTDYYSPTTIASANYWTKTVNDLSYSLGNVSVGTTTADTYSQGGAGGYFTFQGSTPRMNIVASGTNAASLLGGNNTIRRGGIALLDGSRLGLFTNTTNTGSAISEKVSILANGHFGVGTISPTYKTTIEGGTSGAETILLNLNSGTTGSNTISTLKFSSSTSQSALQGSSEIANIRLSNNHSNLIFRVSDGSAIVEAARFLGTGFLGLNNNNPLTRLHVTDSGAYHIRIDRGGTIGSGLIGMTSLTHNSTGDMMFDMTQASQGFIFRSRDVTNTIITSLAIDRNGNAGIGTPAPQNKLHIVDSNAYQIRLERTGVASALMGISAQTANSTGDLLFDMTQASQGYAFRTRNGANTILNSFSINRDGDVGIGTFIPLLTLDARVPSQYARPSIGGVSPDGTRWGYSLNPINASTSYDLVRSSNMGFRIAKETSLGGGTFTTEFSINTSGYVGIGINTITGSAGAYYLQVGGDIYSSSLTGTTTLLKTVSGVITRASVSDITSLLGTDNYILNQLAGPQAANMWIDGAIEFTFNENAVNEKNLLFTKTNIGVVSSGYKFSWRNDNNSFRIDTLTLDKNGDIILHNKVGVGTTAPEHRLHVNSSNDDGIYINQYSALISTVGGSKYQAIYFGNDLVFGRNPGAGFGAGVNAYYFRTGNANVNRVVISNLGYVGINVDTQSGSAGAYHLQVGGSIYSSSLTGTDTLLKTVGGVITRATGGDINDLLGAGYFIQNQNALVQTANFKISGSGTFGSNVLLESVGYIDLKINQTDSASVSHGITSGSARAFVNVVNTDAGHVAGTASYSFLFGGTEYARLTSQGNFSIGTSVADTYSQGGSGGFFAFQGSTPRFNVVASGTNAANILGGNETIRRGGIVFMNGSRMGFFTNTTDTGSDISEKVSILANGNFGVGSTNPIFGKLQIVKSSTYNSESSGAIYITSTDTTGATALKIGTDATNSIAYIQAVLRSTSYNQLLALNAAGGSVLVGRIDSVGASKLQVEGSIYSNSLIGTDTMLKTVAGVITRASAADVASLIGATHFIQNQNSSAQTASFWINNTGQAQNFTARSSTANTGSASIITGNTTNSGYLQIYNTAGLRMGYIGFSNTDLNYTNENGANHVFTGAGNVLINGTGSAGSYKLQVFGQSFFRNLTTNGEIARFADITDGSYISVQNWGISTATGNSYIRPSTNNDKNLYIGDPFSPFYKYSNLVLTATTVTFNEQTDFKLLKTSAAGVLQQATAADVNTLLGTGYFIQNQNAAAQASSNAWISGTFRADTEISIGKTGTAGLLRFRRSSDGTTTGSIGFTGSGNLNITSSEATNGIITFTLVSTERGRFTNNGKFLIGTVTENSFKVRIDAGSAANDGLHINGNLTVTGNAIIEGYFSGTYSDSRLKSDFKSISVIDKIDEIGVYSYRHQKYKDGRLIGSVAQELQKFFPELISKDSNGFLRVNEYGYSALSFQLCKEIVAEMRERDLAIWQQTDKNISEIAKLKTEVRKLKTKVRQLSKQAR